MPRPSDREIEESFDRMGMVPDAEDDALIRHVLLDDVPPQGLHRHGHAHCSRHGEFYAGNAKCPACQLEEEDRNVDDYHYPGGWDDDGIYDLG